MGGKRVSRDNRVKGKSNASLARKGKERGNGDWLATKIFQFERDEGGGKKEGTMG